MLQGLTSILLLGGGLYGFFNAREATALRIEPKTFSSNAVSLLGSTINNFAPIASTPPLTLCQNEWGQSF